MDFAWIESGRFLMGTLESEVGRREDEGPQHEVMLTEGSYGSARSDSGAVDSGYGNSTVVR